MRDRSCVFAALWVLLTTPLAPNAVAQEQAWRITGDARSERFGAALERLPDRNGDGIDDLLVGVPGSSGTLPSGGVRVLSGADLALLLEVDAGTGHSLGSAVGATGDVDGDGLAELLVASADPGIAQVRAGSDGRVLREWTSNDPAAAFGSLILGLGDLDGDGIGEIAVGEEFGVTATFARGGLLHVYAGNDGRELATLAGREPTARVGGRNRVARFGDVDGDAVEEFAWIDVARTGGPPVGVIRITSGATFLELRAKAFDRGDLRDYTPVAIADGGDFDGDGFGDLLVGALPIDPTGTGRVFVFASSDGRELLRSDIGNAPRWVVVARSGDLDADGLPEFAAAATDDNFFRSTPLVELHRGSDGSLWKQVTGPADGWYGQSLIAASDYDGDGNADLVAADAIHRVGEIEAGVVETRRLPATSLIARREGAPAWNVMNGAVAQVGDQDRDGFQDVLVAAATQYFDPPDTVVIRAGSDGRELARHSIDGIADGALAALPDLDGDSREDFAIGVDTFDVSPRVQVRSSATGAKIHEFTGPSSAGSRYGAALAVSVMSSGAVHLAIGAKFSDLARNDGGQVDVHDARSGALLFQKLPNRNFEQLGSALAALDDLNGDGVGDWAFGAAGNSAAGSGAGRVAIVSGADGVTLTSLFGNTGDFFGYALAALRDLDGDGIGDFAVGAPFAANTLGEVRVFAGATFTLLATVSGTASNDQFGTQLVAVGDVNGDGLDDWVARGSRPDRAALHSGAHGRLLVDLASPSYATRLARREPWQAVSLDGDGVPDLLAVDAIADDVRSRLWLVALDPLLLDLDPPLASAGDVVAGHLRGAPAGGPSVLIRIEVDGAPDFRVMGNGAFDSFGEWSTSGDVPPAFPDHEWLLQGYALGFDGKLTPSGVVKLRFR